MFVSKVVKGDPKIIFYLCFAKIQDTPSSVLLVLLIIIKLNSVPILITFLFVSFSRVAKVFFYLVLVGPTHCFAQQPVTTSLRICEHRRGQEQRVPRCRRPLRDVHISFRLLWHLLACIPLQAWKTRPTSSGENSIKICKSCNFSSYFSTLYVTQAMTFVMQKRCF